MSLLSERWSADDYIAVSEMLSRPGLAADRIIDQLKLRFVAEKPPRSWNCEHVPPSTGRGGRCYASSSRLS